MDLTIKEIEVKSVLTKSNLPVSDYSVNPYVGCTFACKYCYASFMKRFTNHPEPWGDFLDVKTWAKIKNPQKYAGKEMFLGSVTDPYNPQEKKYERTRTLLQEMQGSGIKLSISTKSDLVLRDLEAMKQFHDAGIRTTCFISPIFPEITDVKAIIERAKGQCNLIWLENLNLRGDYKAVIIKYIREKHPHLLGTYQEIYQKGNPVYWESLNLDLKHYTESIGLEYVRNDDSMQRPFEAPPIVVNFFYHSQITKSAIKAKQRSKTKTANSDFNE